MKQLPRKPRFQTQLFAPRVALPQLKELPSQIRNKILSSFAQLLRQRHEANRTQQGKGSDER